MWDMYFRRLLFVRVPQKIMQIASFYGCKICSLYIEMLKAKTFDMPYNKLSTLRSWLSDMSHSCLVASSGLLESFAVSLNKQTNKETVPDVLQAI